MSKEPYTRANYNVPLNYTKKEPISNLIDAGGATFYGLFMYLYDYTILRDGVITRDLIEWKAKRLGVKRKALALFLDVATANQLLVFDPELEGYFLPDVQAHLQYAQERRRKNQERIKDYWSKRRVQETLKNEGCLQK